MKRPLTRPKIVPEKIPLWAWELESWQRDGRRGARPVAAPRLVPVWFWAWKAWGLRRARAAGSKQITTPPPTPAPVPPARPKKKPPTVRQRMCFWGRWGAKHEPDIHYTEGAARDDWLVNHDRRGTLPLDTDCSGFVTLEHYWAGAPDPNGLAYRYLGYTGTILDTAYKHGKVLTDVSQALPGDPIVIGPGTGWHVVTCLVAGPDPLVVSHGDEAGPVIQRLSVDQREPKRVCQLLPKDEPGASAAPSKAPKGAS